MFCAYRKSSKIVTRVLMENGLVSRMDGDTGTNRSDRVCTSRSNIACSSNTMNEKENDDEIQQPSISRDPRLETIIPWLEGFLPFCYANIGVPSSEKVERLMHLFRRCVATNMKTALRRKRQLLRFRKFFIDTLYFFHMGFNLTKKPFDCSGYTSVMTSLLAMCLDLEIKIAVVFHESPEKVRSRIITCLHIFLDKSVPHMIDVFLKATLVKKRGQEICEPILCHLLDLERITSKGVSESLYVRCVLGFKLYKQLLSESQDKCLIDMPVAAGLPSPHNFQNTSNFRAVFPKVPEDENDVTLFLLRTEFDFAESAKAFFEIVDDFSTPSMTADLLLDPDPGPSEMENTEAFFEMIDYFSTPMTAAVSLDQDCGPSGMKNTVIARKSESATSASPFSSYGSPAKTSVKSSTEVSLVLTSPDSSLKNTCHPLSGTQIESEDTDSIKFNDQYFSVNVNSTEANDDTQTNRAVPDNTLLSTNTMTDIAVQDEDKDALIENPDIFKKGSFNLKNYCKQNDNSFEKNPEQSVGNYDTAPLMMLRLVPHIKKSKSSPEYQDTLNDNSKVSEKNNFGKSNIDISLADGFNTEQVENPDNTHDNTSNALYGTITRGQIEEKYDYNQKNAMSEKTNIEEIEINCVEAKDGGIQDSASEKRDLFDDTRKVVDSCKGDMQQSSNENDPPIVDTSDSSRGKRSSDRAAPKKSVCDFNNFEGEADIHNSESRTCLENTNAAINIDSVPVVEDVSRFSSSNISVANIVPISDSFANSGNTKIFILNNASTMDSLIGLLQRSAGGNVPSNVSVANIAAVSDSFANSVHSKVLTLNSTSTIDSIRGPLRRREGGILKTNALNNHLSGSSFVNNNNCDVLPQELLNINASGIPIPFNNLAFEQNSNQHSQDKVIIIQDGLQQNLLNASNNSTEIRLSEVDKNKEAGNEQQMEVVQVDSDEDEKKSDILKNMLQTNFKEEKVHISQIKNIVPIVNVSSTSEPFVTVVDRCKNKFTDENKVVSLKIVNSSVSDSISCSTSTNSECIVQNNQVNRVEGDNSGEIRSTDNSLVKDICIETDTLSEASPVAALSNEAFQEKDNTNESLTEEVGLCLQEQLNLPLDKADNTHLSENNDETEQSRPSNEIYLKKRKLESSNSTKCLDKGKLKQSLYIRNDIYKEKSPEVVCSSESCVKQNSDISNMLENHSNDLNVDEDGTAEHSTCYKEPSVSNNGSSSSSVLSNNGSSSCSVLNNNGSSSSSVLSNNGSSSSSVLSNNGSSSSTVLSNNGSSSSSVLSNNGSSSSSVLSNNGSSSSTVLSNNGSSSSTVLSNNGNSSSSVFSNNGSSSCSVLSNNESSPSSALSNNESSSSSVLINNGSSSSSVLSNNGSSSCSVLNNNGSSSSSGLSNNGSNGSSVLSNNGSSSSSVLSYNGSSSSSVLRNNGSNSCSVLKNQDYFSDHVKSSSLPQFLNIPNVVGKNPSSNIDQRKLPCIDQLAATELLPSNKSIPSVSTGRYPVTSSGPVPIPIHPVFDTCSCAQCSGSANPGPANCRNDNQMHLDYNNCMMQQKEQLTQYNMSNESNADYDKFLRIVEKSLAFSVQLESSNNSQDSSRITETLPRSKDSFLPLKKRHKYLPPSDPSETESQVSNVNKSDEKISYPSTLSSIAEVQNYSKMPGPNKPSFALEYKTLPNFYEYRVVSNEYEANNRDPLSHVGPDAIGATYQQKSTGQVYYPHMPDHLKLSNPDSVNKQHFSRSRFKMPGELKEMPLPKASVSATSVISSGSSSRGKMNSPASRENVISLSQVPAASTSSTITSSRANTSTVIRKSSSLVSTSASRETTPNITSRKNTSVISSSKETSSSFKEGTHFLSPSKTNTSESKSSSSVVSFSSRTHITSPDKTNVSTTYKRCLPMVSVCLQKVSVTITKTHISSGSTPSTSQVIVNNTSHTQIKSLTEACHVPVCENSNSKDSPEYSGVAKYKEKKSKQRKARTGYGTRKRHPRQINKRKNETPVELSTSQVIVNNTSHTQIKSLSEACHVPVCENSNSKDSPEYSDVAEYKDKKFKQQKGKTGYGTRKRHPRQINERKNETPVELPTSQVIVNNTSHTQIKSLTEACHVPVCENSNSKDSPEYSDVAEYKEKKSKQQKAKTGYGTRKRHPRQINKRKNETPVELLNEVNDCIPRRRRKK